MQYERYLGGILIISNDDFERSNGMSNAFWGWGAEDDEFRINIEKFGVKINLPENITTGSAKTFRDIHNPVRLRDTKKCSNQKKYRTNSKFVRSSNEGLNGTEYHIASLKELTIDDAKVTMINVHLKCDQVKTPWCLCLDSWNFKASKKIKKTGPINWRSRFPIARFNISKAAHKFV